MPKTRDKNALYQAIWPALAVIIIFIFGTVYAVVQQSQRSDANYPQIQLAEDAAAALNGGTPPNLAQSTGTIAVQSSLAPFVIVYDKRGMPLYGTGYLHGVLPKAPIGILQSSRGKPYHSVTWQPERNVRIAAVTVSASNYYVLSGRSLILVEQNENTTFELSFIGGIASETVLLMAYLLSRKKS